MPDPSSQNEERRRIGRVVRDDRGNAVVEWQNAPLDFDRPPLSIDDSDAPVRRRRGGEGYNPYEPAARRLNHHEPSDAGRSGKRDLRALSEWIKKMRELEERRRRGGDDEG